MVVVVVGGFRERSPHATKTTIQGRSRATPCLRTLALDASRRPRLAAALVSRGRSALQVGALLAIRSGKSGDGHAGRPMHRDLCHECGQPTAGPPLVGSAELPRLGLERPEKLKRRWPQEAVRGHRHRHKTRQREPPPRAGLPHGVPVTLPRLGGWVRACVGVPA